jgi:uncharacterized membrane protein
MNNVRIAASVFFVLSAIFVLLFAFSSSSLPPTVATHFDGYGRPNAWMRSSSYLTFFIAFGIGLPVIIVALFYMVRWLPAGLINIPRRDFWLASERAPETQRYLLARGLWLACMMLLFMLGVHFAVVRANQLAPPRLAPQSILVPAGLFITALVIWIVTFLRHFTAHGRGPTVEV